MLSWLQNQTYAVLRNESKLRVAFAHARNRYRRDERLLKKEKVLLEQAIKAETLDESRLNKRLAAAEAAAAAGRSARGTAAGGAGARAPQ